MKRRDFAGLLLAAAALTRLPVQARANRTLVVLELTGGNDSLNTFIPYQDPAYLRLRPNLGIKDGLPISPETALHPALKDLKPLLDQGNLAILQNVGYPNPDLSHFRSKEIWQSARVQGTPDTGWLARYLESRQAKPEQAIFLGEEYPGPDGRRAALPTFVRQPGSKNRRQPGRSHPHGLPNGPVQPLSRIRTAHGQ